MFFFCKGEPLITIGPNCILIDHKINKLVGKLCLECIIGFLIIGMLITIFFGWPASTVAFDLGILITAQQIFLYLMVALKNPGICSTTNAIDEDAAKKNLYIYIINLTSIFII